MPEPGDAAGRAMTRAMAELLETLRLLRRRPGGALLAAGTIGVGLAAVAVVVALANTLFLAPLPGVAEPQRLVRVTTPDGPSSVPNLRDLGERSRTLAGLSVFADETVRVGAFAAGERVLAVLADSHYFPLLGVPLRGRSWTAAEDAAGATVVVLGHDLWQRRFGGDPAVLGRTVEVQGQPLTVVGIAPPGFVGTFRGFAFELWAPLGAAPRLAPRIDVGSRDVDRFEAVGRLRPGVEVAAAATEIATLGRQLRREHAAAAELVFAAAPVTGLDDELRGPALLAVGALLGLALLVLGLTLANVTGMQLARLLGRRGELALRTALGASRGSLGRLLLWEALLVALGGAAVAAAGAAVFGRLLTAAIGALPVRLALDFVPQGRALALFLAVVAVVALLLALPGVAALRRGSHHALVEVGRGGTGGRGRLRAALVVVQVAAASALLLAGALFARVLRQAADGEDQRLAAVLAAPMVDPHPLGLDPAAEQALRDRLLAAAMAAPGATAAALVSRPPLAGGVTVEIHRAEVAPEPGRRGLEVHAPGVRGDYFGTLGIRLVEGRGLRADTADAGEVVVDADVAARLWPRESPLGRQVRIEDELSTVVGVSEPLRGAVGEQRLTVLRGLSTRSGQRFALLVRSRGSGAVELAGAVRQAVAAAAPGLPPLDLQPLVELREVAVIPQRLAAGAGRLLGSAGLAIAAAGLYGLLSLLLAQSSRELAVRAALGAGPRGLVGRFVGRAAALALAGYAVAAILVWPLAPAIAGDGGLDGGSLLGVAAAVVAAAAAAAALPAWRAGRVDPARALRGA